MRIIRTSYSCSLYTYYKTGKRCVHKYSSFSEQLQSLINSSIETIMRKVIILYAIRVRSHEEPGYPN